MKTQHRQTDARRSVSNDRRASKRVPASWECVLNLPDGKFVHGMPKDVSRHGLYLDALSCLTDVDMFQGDFVRLDILDERLENPLHCKVVRATTSSVALQYTEKNSHATIRKLEAFIYQPDRHARVDGLSLVRIRLESVSRRWGKNIALENLSASFTSGETIALVGPSGSGKSTLFRLIAGVLRPTHGDVWVNERNLDQIPMRELRRHRGDCGIIQQNHLLIPQTSVHQNIVSGLLAKWPLHRIVCSSLWPVEKERVASLLNDLEMGEFQWQIASNLSGGQQQRVAVARALVSNPRIVLADEPTASLDPVTAKSVTQLIVQQAKKRRALLVFCTHHLDIIKTQCDRVIGLRGGQCVFDTHPELLENRQLEQLYAGSRERISA